MVGLSHGAPKRSTSAPKILSGLHYGPRARPQPVRGVHVQRTSDPQLGPSLRPRSMASGPCVTLFTHLLLRSSERRLDPTARKLSGKTRTAPQGHWRSQRPRWAIHRFGHSCLSLMTSLQPIPVSLPRAAFLSTFSALTSAPERPVCLLCPRWGHP